MKTLSPGLFAAITISTAASLGLAAATFTGEITARDSHDHSSHTHAESAHAHALFFVSVNGTNLDFSNSSYQLQSRDVHLEAGNPRVVHRHEHGVTWQDFLDTVNLSVQRGANSTCVELQDRKMCGRGEVTIDGSEVSDLDTEIEQDQNLVIALGPNATSRTEELSARVLPDDYRPQYSRGDRI
nr:MAG: hypothetical protein J07AB56_06120 [Candidatus Nanosalinarum sp. J07AB56]